MAGLINISGKITISRSLARVGLAANVLWMRLLVEADRWGRLSADPELLIARCLPIGTGDDFEWTVDAVIDALEQLASEDMIEVYESDGEWYLQIVKYDEYQRRIVGQRRGTSDFPDPPFSTSASSPSTAEAKLSTARGGADPQVRYRDPQDRIQPFPQLRLLFSTRASRAPRAAATQNLRTKNTGSGFQASVSEGSLVEPLASSKLDAREAPDFSQSGVRTERELFAAVAAACSIDTTRLTTLGRHALNTALLDLRGVGAKPDEVPRAVRAYRRKFPDASITAFALAKHWASLVTPPGGQSYVRA